MQSRSPAATAKRKQCARRRLGENINLKDDAPVSQATGANTKAGDARRHACQLPCRETNCKAGASRAHGPTAKEENARTSGKRRARRHKGQLQCRETNCKAGEARFTRKGNESPQAVGGGSRVGSGARRATAKAHEPLKEAHEEEKFFVGSRSLPPWFCRPQRLGWALLSKGTVRKEIRTLSRHTRLIAGCKEEGRARHALFKRRLKGGTGSSLRLGECLASNRTHCRR